MFACPEPEVTKAGRGRWRRTISSAILATIPQQIWIGEISTDLLWCGPEIIQRAWLVGEDVACRDEDAVCTDSLPAVGEPEGVVKGECCFVVGEAIEVPVCLRFDVNLCSSDHTRFHRLNGQTSRNLRVNST